MFMCVRARVCVYVSVCLCHLKKIGPPCDTRNKRNWVYHKYTLPDLRMLHITHR